VNQFQPLQLECQEQIIRYLLCLALITIHPRLGYQRFLVTLALPLLFNHSPARTIILQLVCLLYQGITVILPLFPRYLVWTITRLRDCQAFPVIIVVCHLPPRRFLVRTIILRLVFLLSRSLNCLVLQ
jgi:hypothetical protein